MRPSLVLDASGENLKYTLKSDKKVCIRNERGVKFYLFFNFIFGNNSIFVARQEITYRFFLFSTSLVIIYDAL